MILVYLLFVSCWALANSARNPPYVIIVADHVYVSRAMTLFCQRNCGGPCDFCCTAANYRVSYSLTTTALPDPPYRDLCLPLRGIERDTCEILILKLGFICARASYKYVTMLPPLEFRAESVFPTTSVGLNYQKRDAEQAGSGFTPCGAFVWKAALLPTDVKRSLHTTEDYETIEGFESIGAHEKVEGLEGLEETEVLQEVEYFDDNDEGNKVYNGREIYNYEIYVCGNPKHAAHFVAIPPLYYRAYHHIDGFEHGHRYWK